jgi:hypothetical protein
MPDRRDPDRVRHAMFEMVMARVSAIACGHKDAIDLDRLRHDPLMKTCGRRFSGCLFKFMRVENRVYFIRKASESE